MPVIKPVTPSAYWHDVNEQFFVANIFVVAMMPVRAAIKAHNATITDNQINNDACNKFSNSPS